MSDGRNSAGLPDRTRILKQKLRFPTQITISPDGATLIVVDADPGTPEVAFYDTASFAKKGSLVNPDPTKYVMAFSIFNKAVLAPDGKTGIIASRGRNNVFYNDKVFLFDATNGTILRPARYRSGTEMDGLDSGRQALGGAEYVQHHRHPCRRL